MKTETEDLLSSMMLWNGSYCYLEAARTLFTKEEPSILPMPPSDPTYFLACQAIELALKAFLRGSGKDETFLAKVCNHNLAVALKAAEEIGLNKLLKLDSQEHQVLNSANQLYSTKALQFGISGRYSYPHFEPLLKITEKIVIGTEEFCMKNAERHTGRPTSVNRLHSTHNK